jgi:succinate dehydrogenase / fumarate reductase, cytochrome b subunit
LHRLGIEDAALDDPREAMMVGRRSDSRLVDRPLSPHLQVYRWPVSMALSISHRVTGVGVSVGALLMTWWLVAAAASDSAFATVQGFLGSGFGVFLLLCWAAALLLHLFQGIRQLAWDGLWGFGPLAQQEPVRRGYEGRTYRTTGWIVIGATVVATLIVWIVGFVVW